MAKQEETQTMEEYLLSQLDTPVVLKDGTTMTIEELEKVPFHFVAHMSMEDMHTTTYESDDGQFGFCDHVPFKNGEPHGRAFRHYRIGLKVYKSKAKFIEALKDV